MSADPVERKLAAILSADVVGYSRLMAEDEAGTVDSLKSHRELMGGLIRQHTGRVVDAVGDNLLAEFPSVVDAVACAVAIQNNLAIRNEDLPPDRRMLFRIGVHLGDVIAEGDRIYGDGVNIAARVEALAEEGGISISGTAFDQVEGKLGLEFDDLGPQELKNIPRPVRVYRVQVAEAHETEASLTVPGFSGRPAIAVLPFENMSGDAEQEYFADGIAEDLITRLSAWRKFPVIARNSSFVYKGKAVDVKQVSRELGVRYVVEGSVRKAGERVRISAQVIDATTGHHVWAERYDREFQDIFALQDEITESIVCSIEPTLDRVEQRRALRQPREKLTAWDLVQQGTWHLDRFTKEDTATARRLFRRAIELDPHFSPAFTQLAMTGFYEVFYQWSEAPAQALAESNEAAQQAAALDEEDPHALAVAGASWAFGGKNERGISILERAIELNPSAAFAYWMLGTAYSSLDQQDRGIDLIEKAIRLSPHDSLMHQMLQNLGIAHLMKGRYEDAATCARRILDLRPDQPHAYRLLAASYGHLGRGEEARSALDAMYRLPCSPTSRSRPSACSTGPRSSTESSMASARPG
jgi:adenylate cyclase